MPEPAGPLLYRRLIAIHRGLDAGGFAHAIGGAVALGAYVEPRFTADLDLNVIADPNRPEPMLAALPSEIEIPSIAVKALARDQQVRLFWPDPRMPIDLFLPAHPTYHHLVAQRAAPRSFLGEEIPVITATDLMVFKMMFNRSKDWVDIESLLVAGAGDPAEAAQWIGDILGDDAPQLGRLAQMRTELEEM